MAEIGEKMKERFKKVFSSDKSVSWKERVKQAGLALGLDVLAIGIAAGIHDAAKKTSEEHAGKKLSVITERDHRNKVLALIHWLLKGDTANQKAAANFREWQSEWNKNGTENEIVFLLGGYLNYLEKRWDKNPAKWDKIKESFTELLSESKEKFLLDVEILRHDPIRQFGVRIVDAIKKAEKLVVDPQLFELQVNSLEARNAASRQRADLKLAQGGYVR